MIYNESAKVISNFELAEGIYKTTLYAPKISSCVKPGQFINILPKTDWPHVMRRPMSIASQIDDEISIIYKAVGEGTTIMSNWSLDLNVDIIGPLGNFWTNYQSSIPVLVGGGVGIAPILNLHNLLIDKKIKHYLIMGARNSREHFFEHNLKDRVFLSTDDGSIGVKGNVVDALNELFNNKLSESKIFSCGPPMMMESVREFALKNKIKCDLAVETIMACGIGICQGCTVEMKVNENKLKHTYRSRFALACVDGPIFAADDIVRCI